MIQKAAIGSKNSSKICQESESQELDIEMLRNKKESCTVEKFTKRLPVINKPLRISGARKTSSNDPSETEKPSVILPKIILNKREIPQQPVYAGEPHVTNSHTGDFRLPLEKPEKQIRLCPNIDHYRLFDSTSSQASEWLEFPSQSNLDVLSVKSKFHESIPEVNDDIEPIVECNALKRWHYWMEDKRKTQNLLSKKLGRDPYDLMMQESDKYREVVEKKLMLWYSRVPEPDKWRGSPARWHAQLRIKNEKTPAQYCLIKTKMEKGEMPEVECVGLSVKIKKEKGLLPEEAVEEERKKVGKKVHCKEEKTRCDSHEIQMDELAVIGVNVFDKVAQNEMSNLIENIPTIIQPEPVSEGSAKCVDARESIFCLQIAGEEIKYEVGSDCSSQDPEKLFVWNVDFGVNMIGHTVERMLRIENRGTMGVKYNWVSSKHEEKLYLSALRSKHYPPWFFFNKNSGCFLPGQIYHLKFYFQAKTSGVRKETWHLKTNPPLSKHGHFATIIFSGVATENFCYRQRDLNSYLNRRVLESTVSSLLNIVIYNVVYFCNDYNDMEYRSIFTEKQLFEHHNPQHYYHAAIVRELREFFNEIPNKRQKEWDLSLASLCQLIKTYKTGHDLSDSLRAVAKKSFQLLRPNYVTVQNETKYRITYLILCKMTNYMEEDFNYLRRIVSEKTEDPEGDLGETIKSSVSANQPGEETGEYDAKIEMLEIKPINFMFFQTMFHLKVYHRLCAAAEEIAAALETRKFLEPWKKVDYKTVKPPPKRNLSSVKIVPKFCPKKIREEPQVKILCSK